MFESLFPGFFLQCPLIPDYFTGVAFGLYDEECVRFVCWCWSVVNAHGVYKWSEFECPRHPVFCCCLFILQVLSTQQVLHYHIVVDVGNVVNFRTPLFQFGEIGECEFSIVK